MGLRLSISRRGVCFWCWICNCLLLGASNEEVWPRVSKITSWHEYLYGAQMAMSIPRLLWTRWSQMLINVRMYSFWVPHLISVDRLVVLLPMHNGRALWNSKAYQRK